MIKKITQMPKQFKATIAFTISSVITQGLTLLAMPIFVRIMSTEEIGEITNFNSWATILGIIVNMMLYANSFNIAMNEYKNEKDEYTSVSLFVSMFSTVCFFIIYILFENFFNTILNINTELMYLMFLGFLFLPATNMWLTRQRYEYKYVSVLVLSVFSAVASTGLSVGAVLISGRLNLSPSVSRIMATYAITVSIGCYFSVQIFKKGKKIWDKKYYAFILTVNTPTILHSLSKNILDVSDRIMISTLIGKSEAGIYGTLYSITTLIMILWNAIGTAILPYMFECMNDIKNKAKDLQRTVHFIIIMFSVVSVTFILVMPEVARIFTTTQYLEAISIVPPIACGCYITSFYSILGNVLLYNKKTVCLMRGTLIAAVVNLSLNYICIQQFGYQAAAYTTIVGYIALVISLYVEIVRLKNDTASFINMKFMIVVYSVTTLTGLCCYFLYPYIALRYVIILIIILVLWLKRGRLKISQLFR